MFDILVYLFETYYTPEACPQADELAVKLADVGFEYDDIHEALEWLHDLAKTTEQYVDLANSTSNSHRIYTSDEYLSLGSQAIGFISFLENTQALPAVLREIIIDCALLIDESPLSLEKLKIITLIVLWSQEIEIDQLLFAELLTNDDRRLSH